MKVKDIKNEIKRYFGEYDERYNNDVKIVSELNDKKLEDHKDVEKLYTAYDLKLNDISIHALLVAIINEESIGNSGYEIANKIIKECKR